MMSSPRSSHWMTVLFSLVLIGCGDTAPPKESLFEHDHTVAEHWPLGLADVSVKLRERLPKLEGNVDPSVMAEIRDLVGWTAEVAADTELSEADWIPIYDSCESLSGKLQSSQPWGAEQRVAIESLCELIDVSVKKIPVPNALPMEGES